MNTLIIFDFDGVIVNTERTTFEFYKEILPAYGIQLTEVDFRYKAGRKSVDFFRDVLGEKFDMGLVTTLIEKKRETFLADIPKFLKPLPGIFDLLEESKRSGLKLAIGSQNEKLLIQKAVDVFKIRHYFDFMTSLQDIQKKKPDPEVFLLVSSTMGIPPHESIVIEDSPSGIEAAGRGGFASVGITTSFSRKDLGHATKVIDTLTELTPDILINL
ncbi:Haloacid dehalogenase [sediment metagenome]|uniref:Haloacid dehalogenase n=1 Tax=sediment metagenome TaxID=749907 RepID=D9PGN9_9ZZZZ